MFSCAPADADNGDTSVSAAMAGVSGAKSTLLQQLTILQETKKRESEVQISTDSKIFFDGIQSSLNNGSHDPIPNRTCT
jgi:hypothetical protein